MASIAVEMNEWNELYCELRKVLIDLQRAYDKNPTIENRRNLRSYLKEQRDYIEVIAELSELKFNQLYYDMLDLHGKKQYLKKQIEKLSNVKGKKVLVNNEFGKKSIAKAIRNEYLKYSTMLYNLENKNIIIKPIERKIVEPVTLENNWAIDISKKFKEIFNNFKKKSLQFAISAGCALCLTTGGINKVNIFNDDNLCFELQEEKDIMTEELDKIEVIDINEMEQVDDNAIIDTAVPEDLKAMQYELFIKTYADYFALDGDKVVELAKELTDDYKIPFNEINNSLVDGTDNPQIESMMFVTRLYGDNLYKRLKDLGHSKNEFTLDREIKNLSEDYILDSGMHYNDYLVQIADLMQLDKDMALAISYHETGRVTSSKAKNKNNFGGLGEMIFPTPEAGIIYYCCNLKEYEKIVSNMNQLSGRYVNGDINNPSYEWISNVSWFYNDIQENQEDYYGNNNEKSKNLLLK